MSEKGGTCRFNFPKFPSDKTFISRKPEEEFATEEVTAAGNLLQNVSNYIIDEDNENSSNKDMFTELNTNQDALQKAYTTTANKTSVILKRDISSCWINQYCEPLLLAWNANLDVQFVVDAYSCIVYILSYISKREMALLLETCFKECLNRGNTDSKAIMKKIGFMYIHNRELSAQESVYRVCSIPLKRCSRKVLFLPSGPNVVKLSLLLSVLKNRSINGDLDEDDIWMVSFIERYRARPDGSLFDYICYAEFFYSTVFFQSHK